MDAVDELYEGIASSTLERIADEVQHSPAYADLVRELREECLKVEFVAIPSARMR